MSAPYFVGCILHALIAGVATSFAIAAIPELAGTAVYSGLMSFAYGICWATKLRADTDPSG